MKLNGDGVSPGMDAPENAKEPFHQYDNIMEENIDFNGNEIYMDEEENPGIISLN